MEATKLYSWRLEKIEKELDKIRGKEYSLPFGSMARARVSRKWDSLAIEKMKIISELDSNFDELIKLIYQMDQARPEDKEKLLQDMKTKFVIVRKTNKRYW